MKNRATALFAILASLSTAAFAQTAAPSPCPDLSGLWINEHGVVFNITQEECSRVVLRDLRRMLDWEFNLDGSTPSTPPQGFVSRERSVSRHLSQPSYVASPILSSNPWAWAGLNPLVSLKGEAKIHLPTMPSGPNAAIVVDATVSFQQTFSYVFDPTTGDYTSSRRPFKLRFQADSIRLRSVRGDQVRGQARGAFLQGANAILKLATPFVHCELIKL